MSERADTRLPPMQDVSQTLSVSLVQMPADKREKNRAACELTAFTFVEVYVLIGYVMSVN